MASQLNSTNSDLVLNTTGGNDLVFQQDGVEKGRVGAGGFGKVLQVEFNLTSTSISIAPSTYVDTGLSVSITPSSATSKIVCQWNLQARLTTGGGYKVRLLRDATTVYESLTDIDLYNNSGGEPRDRASFTYMDLPNTASEVVYKIQVSAYGNTLEFCDSGNSEFLLMEIAG